MILFFLMKYKIYTHKTILVCVLNICDKKQQMSWRLQWYVAWVVAPALHNVGCWLLDPRTQRRMNGRNSRLLSRITGRSVHDEARSPTFCIVQWAKWKRARWLGHLLREKELSLVLEAVYEEWGRGEKGTLLDSAPDHRSRAHLVALAGKEDGTWKEWCKNLKEAVRPPEKKEGLRRNRGGQRDPVGPVVVVPPPTGLRGERCLEEEGDDLPMEEIFARSMQEVHGVCEVDASCPTDLYTDGSCLDGGKPWAAAGWGVHVVNSDQLGGYYAALTGSTQTNSRAELVAIEAALQLAWGTTHKHCRVLTDCEFAKLGIELWVWKWELNGWRTTGGERVCHADVWKRILAWVRKFEGAADRILEWVHVKAHSGIKGNERADELAAKGSRLRHNLMVQSQPAGWFRGMVERYYGNRI